MLRLLVILITVSFLLRAQTAAGQTDYQKIITNVAFLAKDGYTSGSSYIGSAVTTLLPKVNADGSFNDITYASSTPGNGVGDVPYFTHLSRLNQMALAYTFDGGPHFNSATLYAKIVLVLSYWNAHVNDADNWYYDQIAYPKAIGYTLVLMHEHAVQRTPFTTPLPTADYNAALAYLSSRLNPSTELGANRVDESIHWLCRGALTENPAVVSVAITQTGSTMEFVSRGLVGINYDFSFLQHSSQLLTQTYGSDLLIGYYQIVYYIHNTSYSFTSTQNTNAYQLLHGAYNGSLRGKHKDFNLNGRAISRPGNLQITNYLVSLALKSPGAQNISLKNDSLRISELTGPGTSLDVPPHIHYWNGDYTAHQTSNYFFSVRAVSKRTNRAESINGENLLGTFMTEGVTNIRVQGGEYFDIFPCWNWSKLPGTTLRQYAVTPTNPTGCCAAAPTYYGTEDFVGGVTDSVYGASAYTMDYFNVQAKKSWFLFGNEVVCLGAGIQSTAPEVIATTLNQCLLSGAVNYKAGGATATLGTESNQSFTNLNWVYHNNVGYIFPQLGNCTLSNQTQSGSWKTINTAQSATILNKNIFCLQWSHGATPANGSYQYILLPGVSNAAAVDAYYTAMPITVLSNTAAVQAVKHNTLNCIQVIFYSAGTISDPVSGLSITVNKPCALLLKQVGSEDISGSVADPAQTQSSVQITLSYGTAVNKTITLPSGNFRGASIPFTMHVPISLPLTFAHLSVQEQGQSLQISWTCYQDQEVENYFVEEVDVNGIVTVIGQVPSKKLLQADYDLPVEKPFNAVAYFRITAHMHDGTTLASTLLMYKQTATRILIVPNPASETITLQCGTTEELTVEIRNMLGVHLLEQKVSEEKVIPIHHLPSGIYLLVISTKDQVIKVERLIKR